MTKTKVSPEPAEAAIPAATGDAFLAFGLKDSIMKGVREAGFSVPSPIQQQAIPIIMEGRDVVGQAHTGTGKTAAFGLPGLNTITHAGHVEMLVITPTRELATQVGDELFRLGRHEDVRTVAIYGGQPYGRQLDALRSGVQVVVATPGRLLDLLKGGRVDKFIRPRLVVLDEADEMLDMGFLEDIQEIFTRLPAERQTLLFSATMPAPIQALAGKILKNPAFISVNKGEATVRKIEQQYFVIGERERDDAIIRLIDALEPNKSIIFCRTRSEVDRLGTMLMARGYFARGLHGDMEQSQREEVIGAFRGNAATILVATDVAARGLDVADVTHVFNYHIPFNPESYVHRIGRTGRAGRTGMAITLITPAEYQSLKRLQGKVGRIQLGFIPTRKELREAITTKMTQKLRDQEPTREAMKMLTALTAEMDVTDAACRMLAMIMERESVAGPEQIGLDSAAVERLQHPLPYPAHKKFSRGGPPRSGKPYGQAARQGGSGEGRGGWAGKGKFTGKPGAGPKPGGKRG